MKYRMHLLEKPLTTATYMSESFQDYSWIRDYADNISFSDLVSVYLKVFDHLTWNF